MLLKATPSPASCLSMYFRKPGGPRIVLEKDRSVVLRSGPRVGEEAKAERSSERSLASTSIVCIVRAVLVRYVLYAPPKNCRPKNYVRGRLPLFTLSPRRTVFLETLGPYYGHKERTKP